MIAPPKIRLCYVKIQPSLGCSESKLAEEGSYSRSDCDSEKILFQLSEVLRTSVQSHVGCERNTDEYGKFHCMFFNLH